MIVYTRERISRLLKIDFVRFCIVGGTGFVINFVLLTILHNYLSVHIFLAQFVGAEVALFSNFILHHHWTYRHHNVQKTVSNLLVQFHATSWPAILGSALMVTLFEHLFDFNNLLALAVSSMVALLWNFIWSKYVVWRRVTPAQIERIVE